MKELFPPLRLLGEGKAVPRGGGTGRQVLPKPGMRMSIPEPQTHPRAALDGCATPASAVVPANGWASLRRN